MPIRKDNTRKLLSKIDAEIQDRFLKSALLVERDAKRNCPVKTGRLKRSISHIIEKDKAIVGTNVEYAKYVEGGTRRMAARPFLRKALFDNIHKLKRIWGAK